jgi:hypothetical protein
MRIPLQDAPRGGVVHVQLHVREMFGFVAILDEDISITEHGAFQQPEWFGSLAKVFRLHCRSDTSTEYIHLAERRHQHHQCPTTNCSSAGTHLECVGPLFRIFVERLEYVVSTVLHMRPVVDGFWYHAYLRVVRTPTWVSSYGRRLARWERVCGGSDSSRTIHWRCAQEHTRSFMLSDVSHTECRNVVLPTEIFPSTHMVTGRCSCSRTCSQMDSA